jgi:hypothetical protein
MTDEHPDHISLYTSVQQSTPLKYVPLVHDTFSIHFKKFAIDLVGLMFLAFKNCTDESTSQSAGLVTDKVL